MHHVTVAKGWLRKWPTPGSFGPETWHTLCVAVARYIYRDCRDCPVAAAAREPVRSRSHRELTSLAVYQAREMVVERDPRKVDFTKDGQIKLYPDEPTTNENMREFRHKGQSEYFEPCKEAAAMSMRCLDRNSYDRSKCREYFEVYRDCAAAFKKRLRTGK